MKILDDLFDKVIIKYTLLPLLLSLIFWGVLFFLFGSNILDLLANYSQTLPYGNIISNVVSTAGWIVLVILYYLLSISTLGVFSSFFIDKIVKRINEKHFGCKEREITFRESLKGIWVSLKSFLVYILIFIFTFWILFIPVVNVLYQLFMWSILNKKPLVFDSSYLFFDPYIVEKQLNTKIWFLVFITSIIYFIPIISWFGYTLQLIFMTHLVLKNCNKN